MIWSTSMWNLYHTMCEKCEDDTEQLIKLYELIRDLSSLIPSYSCKSHSIKYLNENKNDSVFISKNNFKMFFYTFHNSVKENKKKELELEPIDVLEKYERMDLNEVYLDTIKLLMVLRIGRIPKTTTNSNYTPENIVKMNENTVKMNKLFIENIAKINKLFIEIFGSAHAKGIDEINEDYFKDSNNRQEIFKKITANRKQSNPIEDKIKDRSSDKLPLNPIETKKKIERNISIDISSKKLPTKPIENTKSRQIKRKILKKSLLLSGGLLISILNKNKK